MKITMTLFAYALSADLMRAFESINQPNATIHLFLHSQQRDVVDACCTIARHSNVVYHDYGFNRGVCRGINDTISYFLDSDSQALICWADDMFAHPGDIDRIAAAVVTNPKAAYVASPCWVEKTQRDEYTGMAMSRYAMERIGYFDVNCHPLAFGDVDWIYRARLAGMDRFIAADTYLIHGGAKTRDAQPEQEGEFLRQFAATRDYYEAKWGGDYQHERYEHPFDDPKYGYQITRENADNPYPECAREDVELS